MKYVFVVLLSMVITSNGFAAAAAVIGSETATTDERIATAQHIQRLARNNILWLQGFAVFFENPASMAEVAKLIGTEDTRAERILTSVDTFKAVVMQEIKTWSNIAAEAGEWERNFSSVDNLKSLINAVLIRLPNCEYLADHLSKSLRAKENLFDQIRLRNTKIQIRDFETILESALPFTDEAYQRDCSLFRPKFSIRKKGEKAFFTFNENNTVDINNGNGEYMTIPLAPLPALSIIETGHADDFPYLQVAFPSGLVLIRSSTVKTSILVKALEQLHSRATKLKPSEVLTPEARAAALAELLEEGYRSAGSKKRGKRAEMAAAATAKAGLSGLGSPSTALSTASAAAGPSAAAAGDDGRDSLELLLEEGSMVKVLSEENMRREAIAAGGGGSGAGAGASADLSKGRIPAYVKEATLTLTSIRPMPRPPLSSYASFAGGPRVPTIDTNDKAMLANLLKANGDRRFGDIKTANTYNWENLKLLLKHLGFIETKDNYEFTYNGNSIKLHYIHWSQSALDDKLVNIMFRQMANIGLTEAVLLNILGITSASAGAGAK